MATSSLTDVINQNALGNSQGYPLGVPTSWNWYQGWNPDGQLTPPSNFTSVTGWGQIYPQAGAPGDSNPSASVQIANFQTYVHLTSGAWVQVQNQSTDSIGGAHFLADFSGNSSVAWNETTLSDGSVSVDAPQSGYNDHFWPDSRGTYAPGTVDGVFVEASMKTDNPNANLVADLGADWWLDSGAGWVDGFSNNSGAGSSDWVKLTTSYQNLYFTSLSPQQLQADPPPGMTASSSATTPLVTTPPVTSGATTPVVSVADNTLSVQPGGKVDLGVDVSTTDNNDVVSVNIQNLASYETITDNLDGHTFTGKNITLTAAEVESGLTLQSNYTGSGDLTVTLAVTATGKDPSTGTIATSATKTITVTDPPATAGGSSSSSGGHDHNHSFALLSQSLAGGVQGRADLGQIATAASHASSWLNDSLLTRPQH